MYIRVFICLCLELMDNTKEMMKQFYKKNRGETNFVVESRKEIHMGIINPSQKGAAKA